MLVGISRSRARTLLDLLKKCSQQKAIRMWGEGMVVKGKMLSKEILSGDFPGGPVAKTPSSQRREPRFYPKSKN